MIETLWQDVRLSVRGLIRSRWVSVVAAGSLALGIAVNTTVFSLVQAVVFPRLPYPESHRLLVVESRNEERAVAGMLVSAPDATDIATSAGTLEVSALAADQSSVLRVEGRASRVSGRRVEPTFFDVFRVPAALGRTIGPQDGHGVIVLSDHLWRSHFRADRMIIGAPIRLDGGAVTVVGVMPPRFDPDAEFWTPLAGSTAAHRRDDRQFTLFARAGRTASMAAARVELEALSHRLAAEHPATNRGWTMVPVELSQLHGRDVRKPLLLLQAAVALVLLIAGANIAHILLARGTRRRHEMAVRLSLGATRARLISAFLIDAVVLSAVGGALGLVLSMWGMDLARAIGGFPDVIDPQLNAFVLGFTSAVSILTGVLGPSPCVPDTMWDGPPARSKRRSAALTPCSYPDNVRSVESQIAEFVAPLRLMTFMLTAFGVAGVLLAALGVFGTMSYAVTERRQELAIRAALGAGRTSLLGLVLGSALRITVVGILVGAVLALTSARALGSYLFGVTTADPLTYALVVALLGGVSVVACYRPACLAATADPATLLRP